MATVQKSWHDMTRGISKFDGLEFDNQVWKSISISMRHDGRPKEKVVFDLHIYINGEDFYDNQYKVSGGGVTTQTVSLAFNYRTKIEVKGQADVINTSHPIPTVKPVYVEVVADAEF